MSSIKILIVDDHPVFRFGMRALLDAEPDTEVLGEATTGDEALSLSRELRPDIILMDINMPDMNGLEATHRILQDNSDIKILIVTMVEDDAVLAAVRAGARGYLLKGAEGEETLQAIRTVHSGSMIFSPGAAERLADFVTRPSKHTPQPFPDLTPREREILDLVARGLTNSAIAERLVISPKTVRNQVSTIFSKLGIHDRAKAVIVAREAGLGGKRRSSR